MTIASQISPVAAALIAVSAPLVSFLVYALRGKRLQSGFVAILSISISLLFAATAFFQVWNQALIIEEISWFTIGSFSLSAGVMLNNLTASTLLLIPTIALPVHIYSTIYMKGDGGIHRYWMYLSLFCFAMLSLVVSSNLLITYMFWELVGFASYLLIGFWFTKPAAAQANKKAFIINRIGDLGFLVAIAIVASAFHTLSIHELFGSKGLIQSFTESGAFASHGVSGLWLKIAGFGFFLGAMAKSAQFPLHVWLPDAMEGPTAVSSLIHAATMVAAGVFLICLVFPVFSQEVLLIMALVGAVTALLASFFAVAQFDIKKILAFSTISQLGYMVAGVGIGAYDAAFFHLLTHAFFKCLLFLGAGAVISQMHKLSHQSKTDFDPQDIRSMGALRRYMPWTTCLMIIGGLALAGFPLTSGYLSKDAIVIAAFEWATQLEGFYLLIPISLVLSSIVTSFYIGRLIFKTFFGQPRYLHLLDRNTALQEVNWKMIAPMVWLALFCGFFFFSSAPLSYTNSWVLSGFPYTYPFEYVPSYHVIIPLVLIISSLFTWAIGYQWYAKNQFPTRKGNSVLSWCYNQGYINEFYDKFIIQSILALSNGLKWFDTKLVDGFIALLVRLVAVIASTLKWIDHYIIDGLVNGIATIARGIGNNARKIQTGKLQHYLSFVFIVLLIGLLYMILY